PCAPAHHSAPPYFASFSQLDTTAVRSILRTPEASASAGPSVVTHAACGLLLTTSLPPLFTIFPSTKPSTTTFAPDSIVRLARRFPRMCKEQFFGRIVSSRAVPFMSDELATSGNRSTASCPESVATSDTV